MRVPRANVYDGPKALKRAYRTLWSRSAPHRVPTVQNRSLPVQGRFTSARRIILAHIDQSYNNARMRKCCLLPLLSLALAVQPDDLRAQLNAGAERTIFGTVVAVNTERSLISLRPTNLFGFLRINLTTYRVKQPVLLNGLHSGDRVAGVFSSYDGMLHRLRRLRNCQVFEERK